MLKNRQANGLSSKRGEAGSAIVWLMLVLIIVAGVGLWWMSGRPVELNPEAAAYFATDKAPSDVDNGWFVLMGLDRAPQLSAHEAGVARFKAGMNSQAAQPMDGESSLPQSEFIAFFGNMDDFDCWVKNMPGRDNCPDVDALHEMLLNNFELLVRLQTLETFDRFYQPVGTDASVDLVKDLYRLKLAEVNMFLYKDRPEDALEVWLNGWLTLRKLIFGHVSLEWRKVFVDLLKEWMEPVPRILASDIGLLQNQYRRLFILMRPITPDDFSFETRLRHFGAFAIQKGMGQADDPDQYNLLVNLYYDFAKKVSDALQAPKIGQKYKALVQLSRSHTGVKLPSTDNRFVEALDRFPKGSLTGILDAFREDMALNQYSRMLILSVQGMVTGKVHDDMATHIASLPEFMQNPLTERPFDWDSDLREIYFVTDDGYELRLPVIMPERDDDKSVPDAGP